MLNTPKVMYLRKADFNHNYRTDNTWKQSNQQDDRRPTPQLLTVAHLFQVTH